MTKRLIKSVNVTGEGFTLSNGGCPNSGKVTNPNPGVVYVQETDHVYFNNVCLPQNVVGPFETVSPASDEK